MTDDGVDRLYRCGVLTLLLHRILTHFLEYLAHVLWPVGSAPSLAALQPR